MHITKAVIPIAGFGTRFLPATLSTPKVMIPILDKPSLHFAVEEAAESGIDHVILIISDNQQPILQYFQNNKEIEDFLQARGDYVLLDSIRKISNLSELSFVIQDKPRGLGHAIHLAKSQVGNESFAVLLPDDFIVSDTPTMANMMNMRPNNDGIVVALKKVRNEEIPHLGIVDMTIESGDLIKVKSMIEKPDINEAPSDIAIIGRYILPPTIFDSIGRQSPGALGEIQLTDAISSLLQTHSCFGFLFPGEHFDVGTPAGLLKASVYMALNRNDIGPQFIKWIQQELSL